MMAAWTGVRALGTESEIFLRCSNVTSQDLPGLENWWVLLMFLGMEFLSPAWTDVQVVNLRKEVWTVDSYWRAISIKIIKMLPSLY